MTKSSSLSAQIAAVLGCHAAATILCAGLFVLVMNMPPFTGMPILFYRGLAGLAAAGAVTCGALIVAARNWPSLPLGPRDFPGAAIVAVALNLCVFTLGPVTVDRSISVFMLSRFDAAQKPLTVDDITRDFTGIYVAQWDQMNRRFNEQIASGNLEKSGGGYRLTAQGKAFMRTARLMARVFTTDPRFVGLEGK